MKCNRKKERRAEKNSNQPEPKKWQNHRTHIITPCCCCWLKSDVAYMYLDNYTGQQNGIKRWPNVAKCCSFFARHCPCMCVITLHTITLPSFANQCYVSRYVKQCQVQSKRQCKKRTEKPITRAQKRWQTRKK
jgi:hypothetical protein